MLTRYYFSGRLSQHLLWLACLGGVVGLLAARALVALSPVAGVLAALANPALAEPARRGPLMRQYWGNSSARWAAVMPAFLLLSGLYTSEWAVWRHELFRYLPWLGVPLAFALAVPLTGRQRVAVGAAFVLGTAAAGLATLGQYLANPEAANNTILYGGNISPITGIFHITFGVMLTLACFGGMLLRQAPPVGRVLRAVLLLAAAAAALTLHVLAYRTGLLVFYVALLVTVLRLLFRRRAVVGLALLALLAVGPWLAYQALPSIRQQVGASLWDVHQFQEGHDINQHSLSQRLAAIETAWVVIGQHWLLGVGPADTKAAMLQQYEWHSYGLLPANRVEVHNQYLQALLAGGVVGLALWLGVLVGPLRQRGLRHDAYVGYFLLIQATAMLVDAVLELQTGLNLFVFGYGFLLVSRERWLKQTVLLG